MPTKMMKTKFSKLTVILFYAIIGGGGGAAGADSEMKGSKPNIVFFLGDDQSKFDHSTYGNVAVPTPTTDALAKEGLVFERAFTGQAICAPSRSMLYTGLYPLRNGCFINHSPIRPGVQTLPKYLSDLGYTVVLAGKSHVNPDAQFPWSIRMEPVQEEGLPRPSIPIQEMDKLMKDQGSKPFCLMIASEFPHGPYFDESPYKADDVSLPPFADSTEEAKKKATLYYASIAQKERELASVLKLLEKHGIEDQTIVFYADDHGVTRGKYTAYDSGLNVAFIVRWPGNVPPGRTNALSSFADFVPTVIELAGGTPPEDLDGMSLLPILEKGEGKQHEYVYGVTVNQGIIYRHVFPQRSVHDGRYHYIFNFNSMERLERERAKGNEVNYFIEKGASKYRHLPEEMLFDTQSDPHELSNLAGRPEMADVQQSLKTELFRWMKEQNDYLSEDGPLPFLQTNKKFSLDRADEGHPIPKRMIGSLKGKTIDPHR
ncbi:sulfatase family protein [Novipirellula artificiosorum]|uniref:Arylsulfatase n=1 Tax=Novipirellula artificiosorum TaxID=2528016 RepID=A0A5C6DAN1_9BACT|nr:sulfatase [Novipirellula artificiosorum]TWU33185.1 Arylsulfatase [Novipirellula artificiosorum]